MALCPRPQASSRARPAGRQATCSTSHWSGTSCMGTALAAYFSFHRSRSLADTALLAQLFDEHCADRLWIGPLDLLHHLADQRADSGLLARLEVGDGLWVLAHNLADHPLEFAGV